MLGFGAKKTCVVNVDRFFSSHCIDDDRHFGVVSVADTHSPRLFEIDTFQMFDEGGYEMLAGLLTIADDVDAGILLIV